MRGLLATVAALFVALLPAVVEACPNCAVGREARAEVWADGFGANVLVAALPFAIIGLICVRLEANARVRPADYETEEVAPARGLDQLDEEALT